MGAYPVATYSTHSPPDQQGAKLADQVPALCPGAVLPLAQRTEMWGYPGYGAGLGLPGELQCARPRHGHHLTFCIFQAAWSWVNVGYALGKERVMVAPVTVSEKDLRTLLRMVSDDRADLPAEGGLPLSLLADLMGQIRCDAVSFEGLDSNMQIAQIRTTARYLIVLTVPGQRRCRPVGNHWRISIWAPWPAHTTCRTTEYQTSMP